MRIEIKNKENLSINSKEIFWNIVHTSKKEGTWWNWQNDAAMNHVRVVKDCGLGLMKAVGSWISARG